VEPEKKKKRGGDVKKAPPGYYTARQAREKLGLSSSSFIYYVKKGRIKKYVPPLRTEGFYAKEEIDQLAIEMALFLHTVEVEKKPVARVAEPEDVEGILQVLTVRGWQTTSEEQRLAWYKVNPLIDFVVRDENLIGGYVFAAPYRPEALEELMSGRKHSREMKPEDILPYEPGCVYDVYCGIATRTDQPNHVHRFGFRLLSGFLSFLKGLGNQGIYIRRLYAVSAEPDGQKLSTDLGFERLPAQEGDRFPRYMLDLETSDSHFAQWYRKDVHGKKEAKK
jgi:hypothetical protein